MNNSYDNITIRRTQVNNISANHNESVLDVSSQSLTEFGQFHCVEQSELIEKNNILMVKLETANGEIDNLTMENALLKKEITDCQNKLKIYKTVGIDDIIKSTPARYLSPYYRRVRPSLQTGIPRTSPNQFTCRSAELLTIRQVATSNINDTIQNSFNTSSPKDTQKFPDNKNKVYRPEEDVATIHLSKSSSVDTKPDTRQRVALFSDAEGRGMRPFLQNLLGGGFKVSSLLKPNAPLDQILEGCDHICRDFTKKDYIIIITKSFDKNPLRLQSFLYYYLNMLQHTNVLFSEVCSSMYLNEAKLNSVIKIVCNNFKHATFVDFHGTGIHKNNKFLKCRALLREILKNLYHHNYREYVESSRNTKPIVSYANKCIQTDTCLSLTNCDRGEVEGTTCTVNDNIDGLFR